jgi:uncharacterized protein (DUF342 family)
MEEKRDAESRMKDLEKEILLAEERMRKLKEDLENVDPQVVERAQQILQANAEVTSKNVEDLDLGVEFGLFLEGAEASDPSAKNE